MLISRSWLQRFFDEKLPSAEALGDALTFHAFEIESIEKVGDDEVLDVKVTPNRGHDCLSHRGIAKELSAILEIPLAHDPLAQSNREIEKKTDAVTVSLETKLCKRYIACLLKKVKVGPSPVWLKEHLRSIGQRSVNNVVDAANFVMFDTGQPLHAFDAQKLKQKNGVWNIAVREARNGEVMHALDEKEYALADSMLVISDGNADKVVGIAGVKGGMPSGITDATTDIIIESANFEGVSVRRTARALGLRTEASHRFEQALSPELASYGMKSTVEMIAHMTGARVEGYADVYPEAQREINVSVNVKKISAVLGADFREEEVGRSFTRLGFSFEKTGRDFRVRVPFERLDVEIPEDLTEEVGRIVGYEKIKGMNLEAFPRKPEIHGGFSRAEQMREDFVSRGYSEVITSVFTDEGEREVLNKADSVRPFLRKSLIPGLTDAYEKNMHIKDSLDDDAVRVFEIGVVWSEGVEKTMVVIADEKGVSEKPLVVSEKTEKRENSYKNFPPAEAVLFKPFSKYPYVIRDIALWVPRSVHVSAIQSVIQKEAGEFLVRIDCFDIFEKGEKKSYAFRLIFQSFERTLTDSETNAFMEKISREIEKNKKWKVR